MRKMRALCALLAITAVTAALVTAQPAQAVNSYNSRPAPERTEVGAYLVLADTDGDGVNDRFDWFCSGTMISPAVFLSAAHCAVDWPTGARFFVSLDQDVQGELDAAHALGLSGTAEADWFVANHHAVEGDAVYDPAYGKSQSDPHDISVIDFRDRAETPADVWDFTPAQLPTAGEFTQLGSRTLDTLPWEVVGYGTMEAERGGGPQTHPGGGARYEAPLGFNALTASWLRLGMNQSRGFGGACYGDSGGPNFTTIDGKLVLAATTITGDTPCYATNVAYRLDTPSARTFLAQFVTLP
jgi:hypothetical protein